MRCVPGSKRPTTRCSPGARSLREVDTHVVGPMCHVLWRWTTGDAVGPNMMTRNSLRAEHGLRDAARAGRSPSARCSRRTWAATRSRRPSTSARATARRCSPRRSCPTSRSGACCGRPRTTSRRCRGRARTARSHRGMQSVAFTPASAIAAVFAATGQDLGMVGTSSMAHGTARRVDGRAAGVDPLRRARGRNGRRRHDAAVGPRLARVDRLRRLRARCTGFAQIVAAAALVPRDQRVGGDGDRRQRELLPGPPRARRPAVIALVFVYEARNAEEFEEAYGAGGRMGAVLPQRAGYVGTELLSDIEQPGRYVVDRPLGVARGVQRVRRGAPRRVHAPRRRDRRSCTARSCGFGTFENVWTDERA